MNRTVLLAPVAGRYLATGPVKSGHWLATPAVSLGTGAHGASGTLALTPIDLPAGTYTDLAAEITTAAAGSALRLGVYHSDADGLPSTLVATAGTVSGEATAVASAAFASPITLAGGHYWLAGLSEGGNPSTRKSQPLHMYGTTAADVLAQMRGCFFAAGVATGSLPATVPTLSPTSTAIRVAIKVA